MDIVGKHGRWAWAANGDAQTAEILEGILADEIQHVRFANRWIPSCVREQRNAAQNGAGAVRFMADGQRPLRPAEGNAVGRCRSPNSEVATSARVNVAGPHAAEFTDEEIAVLLDGTRSDHL